jgi:hypothetical protein
MGLESLLSRLQKVRPSAVDRWIARCPAHEDKHPSLAIRHEPDGRILVHCFAGCEPEAILSAIGLSFADVFPEPLSKEFLPRIHAPFSALDALKCLAQESGIIAVAASDVALGATLSKTDSLRVAVAAGRIASALEVVYG